MTFPTLEEMARRVLAADTVCGESRIAPASRNRAIRYLAGYVLPSLPDDKMPLEELLGEVRSRYTGGPCGPYTPNGHFLDGALCMIHAMWGTDCDEDFYEKWLKDDYSDTSEERLYREYYV